MTIVRRNLDQPHEVTAYGTQCGHGSVLDLKALLEAGYGEVEDAIRDAPEDVVPRRRGVCGR